MSHLLCDICVTNSYGQHPVEEQSVANWGPPCALFQSTPTPETNSVKASCI